MKTVAAWLSLAAGIACLFSDARGWALIFILGWLALLANTTTGRAAPSEGER